MNKEKFLRKCNELIEYEDKCLEQLNDYIVPYNKKLNEVGCEIIIRRWWLNFSENNGELKNSRINFNKGYRCTVGIQFQIKGTDPDDEEGIGFQLIENPTAYGLSIFSYTSFKKYKLKFLCKNINKCSNEIIDNGLEKTAKKYNNK